MFNTFINERDVNITFVLTRVLPFILGILGVSTDVQANTIAPFCVHSIFSTSAKSRDLFWRNK
jgi:hypothetical protein